MTGLQVFHAEAYVSPRERQLTDREAHVRSVAYALKEADPAAVREAAAAMARFVPPGAALVPIPSSSGSLDANAALAGALAQLVGGSVLPILRRTTPVEASHQRRRRGERGLSPDEHAASFAAAGPVPRVPIVLVDNVVTTGATLEGAWRALRSHENVTGVVYARGNEVTARRNPHGDAGRRERERHPEGVEGRARVLADRLRSGLVTPQHLSVAGYLGDSAAAFVVPPWRPSSPIPDWSRPVQHALVTADLERELLVRLACDFAEHPLTLFEADRPDDRRPRQAIDAARAWIACPCKKHRVAARAAANVTTYSTGGVVGDAAAAAARATYAADAAVMAADAAGYACHAAAWNAAPADAYERECEWQRAHMIAVLCGDVTTVQSNPPAWLGKLVSWTAVGAVSDMLLSPIRRAVSGDAQSLVARMNPNGDARLRRLERLAAQGDPEAIRALDVVRARTGRFCASCGELATRLDLSEDEPSCQACYDSNVSYSLAHGIIRPCPRHVSLAGAPCQTCGGRRWVGEEEYQDLVTLCEFCDREATHVDPYDAPGSTRLTVCGAHAQRMNPPQAGLNSEGEPVARSPDAERAFWSWFDGSRVVDTEGRPLVVYHGTNARFDTFAAGEFGFHFGHKAVSSVFGDSPGYYLRITNPFVIMKDLGDWKPEAMLSWLVSRLYRGPENIGVSKEDEALALKQVRALQRKFKREIDQDDDMFVQRRAVYETGGPVRRLYELHGFDGVLYKNEGEGGMAYIAFRPSQVKRIDAVRFDPKSNKTHENPPRGDEELRRLERAYLAGDVQAAHAYNAELFRRGMHSVPVQTAPAFAGAALWGNPSHVAFYPHAPAGWYVISKNGTWSKASWRTVDDALAAAADMSLDAAGNAYFARNQDLHDGRRRDLEPFRRTNPPRARRRENPPRGDEEFRRLERAAEIGGRAERAALDAARARVGRPFSPPALWYPTVEIPRSWLPWLGPSRRDREDVDTLAYRTTVWPGGELCEAALIRGGDTTYIRVAVFAGPEDDMPDWEGLLVHGEVYDGAVVALAPRQLAAHRTTDADEVMIRLVDESPHTRQIRPNPPPGFRTKVLDRGWSGFHARAYVGRKAAGHVTAARTQRHFDVISAEVNEDLRRQGIGTTLYGVAADESCRRGYPLRSEGFQRSRAADRTWEKLASQRPVSRTVDRFGRVDYVVPCAQQNPPRRCLGNPCPVCLVTMAAGAWAALRKPKKRR